MKHIALITVCIAALLIHITTTATAQTVGGTITAPSDGAVIVPRQPVITVITSHPIDSSSIVSHAEYDSATGTTPLPTILLRDQRDADSLGADSLRTFGAYFGTYTLVNDTTLEFRPSGLGFGQKYVAILTNLQVVSGNDTLSVSEDTVSFTVVEEPHRVVWTTLDETGEMNCGDTIIVTYSRPIGSISSSDLITLSHAYYDYTDSTFVEDSVAISTWVSPDSSSVFVLPATSLTAGGSYLLYLQTGDLTGDTVDNRQQAFRVRNEFTVSIDIVPANGQTQINPAIPYVFTQGVYRYHPGDTVWLYAYQHVENQDFVRWESGDVALINNDSSSTTYFVFECHDLRDVAINAVYKEVPLDTLMIGADSRSVTKVYNEAGTMIGGIGTYYYRRNEALTIINIPDSGYYFTGWTGGGGLVSNPSFPMILILGSGSGLSNSIWGGNQNLPVSAVDYGFHATVTFKNLDGASGPAVVTLMPNNGPNDKTNYDLITQNSVAVGISAVIQDNCFEITDVIEFKVSPAFMGQGIPIPVSVNGPMYNGTFATTFPHSSCNIIVDRKRYDLQAEQVWSDGDRIALNNPDVKILIEERVGAEWRRIPAETADSNHDGQADTRYIDLKCGTQVRVTPWIHGENTDDFEFSQWLCEPGYLCQPGEQMSFTMDADKKVKAEFKPTDFKIVSVGLYQIDGNTITYHDPHDFPQSGLQLLNTGGTDIIIEFNQSVNISSAGVKAQELDERIDGFGKAIYHHTPGYNASWGPNSDGDANARLTFTLRQTSTGRYVNKLQRLRLVVSQYTRSASGTSLSNWGAFEIRTENPDVAVWYDRVKVLVDAEGLIMGNNEVYDMWMLNHRTRQTATVTDGQLPPGGHTDVEEGGTLVYNAHLGTVLFIGDDDEINLGIVTMEEDDGNGVFENIATVLDVADGTLEGLGLDNGSVGAPASVIIDAVATLLRSGVFNNPDERLGYNSWSYRKRDWWGAHPSVAGRNVAIRRDGVEYTVYFHLD